MEIKDKVIIVTGATDGIGREIARKLAPEGAKVVLAARTDEKLAELAHGLPNSVAVHTDMTDENQIQNLVDRTMEIHGRIDILINNAGQGMYGPMEKVDMDKYKHMMNLNLFGPVFAMKLVIPHMRAQGGGMILNISSRVSKNYFQQLGPYASTKYALNGISLTAREELKKDNIIVSIMLPKMTSTSFGKNALGSSGGFEERVRANNLQIDTPDAVADVVLEQIRSEAAEASM